MQQPASSSPPYLWIETAPNAITAGLPPCEKKLKTTQPHLKCFRKNIRRVTPPAGIAERKSVTSVSVHELHLLSSSSVRWCGWSLEPIWSIKLL